MEETAQETLPATRRLPFPVPRPTPEPPWSVSPDVLQVVYLDEIAGRLEELGELTKALGSLVLRMEAQMEKIPEGRMRPYTKTITGDTITRWEVKSEKWVGRPCSSATIYNDGNESDTDESVYVCLNDVRDGFQEIKVAESLDFNFRSPKIERFFFKAQAGSSANIRIALEY